MLNTLIVISSITLISHYLLLFTAGKVCEHGVESVDLMGLPAVNSKVDTPQLVEVSTDAIEDNVLEISVTATSSGKAPSVLVESTALDSLEGFLSAEPKRAVVFDLGKEAHASIPQEIHSIIDELSTPDVYLYPSADSSIKVVIVFTPEENKPYKELLQNGKLYDVKQYTGVEDIPGLDDLTYANTEDMHPTIPVILLTELGTLTKVHKCSSKNPTLDKSI